MQLPAGSPIELGQPGLDVEVDVLELGAEREVAGLDLALDLLQPGDDRVALAGAQNADRGQHPGVRPGAPRS